MEKKESLGGEIGKQLPIKEVYDDLAHPVLSTLGQALQGTVKLALSPLTAMIWGYDKVSEYLNYAIPEYFARKKIDRNRINTPEPYIAVPTIIAISYCMDSSVLKNMYTKLLASSMVDDTRDDVHPSFVEIIKQMSPNDAKLLKILSDKGKTIPIIDVEYYTGPRQYEVEVQKFTPLATAVFNSLEGITACIDNLERMKIIDIPDGLEESDHELYIDCEKHPKIQNLLSAPLPEGCRREIRKRIICITAFGKRFIDICVN